MVKSLEYRSGIILEEAVERYDEIKDEFERVKGGYSGLNRLRRNMRDEDITTLTDCIGVLFPLSVEECVQSEIMQNLSSEETLHHKIGMIQRDIMIYLSNFKNSGVTLIEGVEGLF